MTAIAAAPARRRIDSRFYLSMNLALLGIVVVGFSRSYYLSAWLAPEQPALAPLFLVHGAIASAWFILAVAQPLLVAGGRTDLHRRLGWAAAGLAALLALSGLAVGVAGMQRGFFATPIDPRRFFAVPFFNALLFGGLVGAAIANRKRSDWHKRLMLLASAAIIARRSAACSPSRTTAPCQSWPRPCWSLPPAWFTIAPPRQGSTAPG